MLPFLFFEFDSTCAAFRIHLLYLYNELLATTINFYSCRRIVLHNGEIMLETVWRPYLQTSKSVTPLLWTWFNAEIMFRSWHHMSNDVMNIPTNNARFAGMIEPYSVLNLNLVHCKSKTGPRGEKESKNHIPSWKLAFYISFLPSDLPLDFLAPFIEFTTKGNDRYIHLSNNMRPLYCFFLGITTVAFVSLPSLCFCSCVFQIDEHPSSSSTPWWERNRHHHDLWERRLEMESPWSWTLRLYCGCTETGLSPLHRKATFYLFGTFCFGNSVQFRTRFPPAWVQLESF